MSLILDKCIEFNDKRKICTAAENGRKYELVNNSVYQIKKVIVDKCIEQKTGEKRCDFLFSINNDNLKRVIFLELKGGALSRALEQLYETINFLKDEFKGFNIDARIVGSRDVPNFKSIPAYKKLAILVGNNNGTLERATNNIMSEKI